MLTLRQFLIIKFFNYFMEKRKSFTEKELMALIQSGNHEEIMKFLKVHQGMPFTPAASQLFVDRGNSEEILAYIKHAPLPERGEIALIKRGEREEILPYIKKYKLLPYSEVKLIRRGVHEEIMCYLKRFKLVEKAVIELIHRDNEEEVCYAAKKQEFGFAGELELLRFGIKRQIMAYIQHRRFCRNVVERLFFKRNEPEEVATYKSLYPVHKD